MLLRQRHDGIDVSVLGRKRVHDLVRVAGHGVTVFLCDDARNLDGHPGSLHLPVRDDLGLVLSLKEEED